jgi:hypothetical protein
MRSRLWMQTAAASHPPRLRKQFITTFRIMIFYYYYYLLSRLQRSHNFKSKSFCTYLLSVIRFPGFFFFFFFGLGRGLILMKLKKSGKLNRTIICPGALVTQGFFFSILVISKNWLIGNLMCANVFSSDKICHFFHKRIEKFLFLLCKFK